jgi:hypothetical protein
MSTGSRVRPRRRRRLSVLLPGAFVLMVGFQPAPARAGPAPATRGGPLRQSAAPPLPLLPTLPQVRIDAAHDHAVVRLDVNLPRGEWQAGDLDLFAAFGAPGAPRALDARLFSIQPPLLEPARDDVGEVVSVEAVNRRPARAFALLGRSQMTGVVLHVREAAFRRATAGGRTARLRIRFLHALPPETAAGREVVVRLGSEGGAPLSLDEIVVGSTEVGRSIRRAEARLCGPEADPYPLAASLDAPPGPPVEPTTLRTPGVIAPSLAVRHLGDDLCIRFWMTS